MEDDDMKPKVVSNDYDTRNIKNINAPSSAASAGVNVDVDETGEEHRYGEYGVIGAAQADESHFDSRTRNQQQQPYQYDEDENDSTYQLGKVQFSTKMYGRSKELERCHDLYKSQRAMQKPGIIFVAGYSGCGKSSLVDEFVKQISTTASTTHQQQHENGNGKVTSETAATTTGASSSVQQINPVYLKVKYEKMQVATPFSALRTLSFDKLTLEERENLVKHDFPHIKENLQEALGNDVTILRQIFPGLRKLFLNTTASSTGSSTGNINDGAGGEDDDGFSVASSSVGGGMSESGVSGGNRQSLIYFSAVSSSSPNLNKARQRRRTHRSINKNRLMFAINLFFRELGTNVNRPLILFVDDIQWADSQSLELIQSLIMDNTSSSTKRNNNLFIFAAYRSNEVDSDHQLTKLINAVEQEAGQQNRNNGEDEESSSPSSVTKPMRMERVELKDLTIQDVGQFIADSLQFESVQEVQTLADVIFSKTLGNPFFTRQAIEHLIRKNVLYYDTISFQWAWNLQSSTEEDDEIISSDLVDMVKSKISLLESRDLQEALIVAAYTRSTFDVDTLLVLLDSTLTPYSLSHSPQVSGFPPPHDDVGGSGEHDKKDRLIDLLEHAVSEGLIVHRDRHRTRASTISKGSARTIPNATNTSLAKERYSFAHDRIQEAARRLMPEGQEKYDLLTRIGNTLYDRASFSPLGEDWMFFVAAQHLNQVWKYNQQHGRRGNDDKEQNFRLSSLNLRTAELSFELFAIPAAIEFCKNGIQTLPEDEEERWSITHYELTLKLYSLAAAAEYGLGHTAEAEDYCNRILSRRETAKDKMPIHDAVPAYMVLLDVMGGKGETQQAYELNLEILRELGFKFPKSRRMQKFRAWVYLKWSKSRYHLTEESVREMPIVSDVYTIDQMEFLQKAASKAMSFGYNDMYVLLCCESVRWIFRHGLIDTSAASLASFANVLMHVYGDFDTSPRVAKLAVMIADRQKNKFNETQALNTANMTVLGWVQPIRTTLKCHIRTHESGLVSGNMEGSFIGKVMQFYVQLLSGMNLQDLDADCRMWVPKMRVMGIGFIANIAAILWQITLNFIGLPGNDHTTVLKGEAMDESVEMYQEVYPFCVIFRGWRPYVFVMFGDFETGAVHALEQGDSFITKLNLGLMYGMETFFRAICLLVAARKKKEHVNSRNYKKAGIKLLKRLKKWVKSGCVNLAGPTRLLEGEVAAMMGKIKSAKVAFEDAADICRRGDFHQFVGLTKERYSILLAEAGDSTGSRTQILQAIDSYERWGANRKVEILKKQISESKQN